MKFNLRTKLTAAFLLITLILFGLISIFANVILEKQFQHYAISKQEEKNLNTIKAVSAQYSDSGGKWNKNGIEIIGSNALENGMMMRFMDSKDNVIWDAQVHNSGMCASIIKNMATTMQSRYANFKGGYTEKIYPISYNGKQVGQVAVGYYGPYFFSENDILFLDSLNRFIEIAALIALIIAFIFGAIMAKQLSNPIKKVIEGAGNIAKGDYKNKLEESSNTTEIHDLTLTLNSLAATLEKQENLRKRLSADVAHELRTPLATLQSHIEAMLDGIWELDANRLNSCHDEVLRINRMVSDMEKLAKFENDGMKLDKSEFDFTQLTSKMVENFEGDLAKKEIETYIKGESQTIVADKDKISQIIINLVSNSIKYSDQGGKIDILIDDDNDEIILRISDKGKGIPKEDLPFIFERFYRADKSRNRLTGGSGIGLAIVKAIVDAHHGSVEVESEIDKGTQFTVRLPKA